MPVATRNSQPATILALNTRLRIVLFLFLIATPAFVLIAKTIRVSLAQTWGDSFDAGSIERAIALDRDNPQLHYTLGMVYLFGGESTSPAAAMREMRQATTLRPHTASYWSGLGKACWVAADQACADQAFERAVELAPTTPRYVWDAAVNSVGASRPGPAIAELKRFLQLQPDAYPQVFQLAWRGLGDSDMLWRDLVRSSGDTAAKLDYLEFLGENGRFDLAGRYWAEMVSAKPVLPFDATKAYLEELLSTAHYQEAAAVWQYLRQTGAVGNPPGPDQTNLVFNGGFEREPLGAGFDWRHQPQSYVTVDFSDASAHSGAHALRLDFTVPQNLEYEPIQQLVEVVPGQTYALDAYIRSEAITSDSGPRLRVTDPQCATCLDVSTGGVTGSTAWHEIGLRFTAGPSTGIVRISVWRPRSRSFPMEISGSAWFDDIALRQVPASTN
jgi:hypothetical protein